jgi:hypothetical protein
VSVAQGAGGSYGLVLDAGMALNISHKHDTVLTNNRSMLTLKILGGPGVGQTRMVTGWNKQTRTLSLEEPLDAHFVPAESILAIVGSFGDKAIVGNRFHWTEVVQWYSNTLGGVIADNSLVDCNVLNGGNVGNASVGAYGACYNGPGTVWYTVLPLSTDVVLVTQFQPLAAISSNHCTLSPGKLARNSWETRRSAAMALLCWMNLYTTRNIRPIKQTVLYTQAYTSGGVWSDATTCLGSPWLRRLLDGVPL